LFDTSQPICRILFTPIGRSGKPGLFRHYDPRKLYAADWIQLEKEIYQPARLVFTRSSYISQSVQNDYQCAPEKTVCVYAGSNSHAITSAKDPAHYSSKNILFVGVNWKSKGGPDLAQAFQSVLERHPDASLTIIGNSPKVDLPQVEVLGYVPLAELAPYYERAAFSACRPNLRPSV
jgi:glycosyltransferase involved in cell wall biosynthesis